MNPIVILMIVFALAGFTLFVLGFARRQVLLLALGHLAFTAFFVLETVHDGRLYHLAFAGLTLTFACIRFRET